MENATRTNSSVEIEALSEAYKTINPSKVQKFTDFPLSRRTLSALSDMHFTHPTDIQRDCIGLALQGRDIVGSAITGSGKTLAFLIPVLENLYVNMWSKVDGVGAIIISPTRELAYQIFEVLKGVGKYHDFSVGLIIGGKNLKFERKRLDKCNILICTPGRLLQHMDENPLFNPTNMRILVLDEADRCLDMGFEKTINAILENLQQDKQTLIFSATQTNSVKDLSRLNLTDPIFVFPKSKETTVPLTLQQNYMIVSLEDKLTVLWSFIKNHLKQKCVVFMASCKQVKYIYEVFCKLRPGTNLLALYGTLHQDRRIAIYDEFLRKKSAVLFATDIASRGLDFPLVHWVVQVDCPENVDQYIHRVGRSARNKESGESLLMLLPSEKDGMLNELEKKSIAINCVRVDPKNLFSPQAKIETILAENPSLRDSAKRAFLAYIKSVNNMKSKNIFSLQNLNFDAFAKSLGLTITPKIRFLKRKERIEQNVENTSGMKKKFATDESNSDSNFDELFIVKKNTNSDKFKTMPIDKPINSYGKKKITKALKAKQLIKKGIMVNTKRKFNDEITTSPKQMRYTSESDD